MITQQDIKEFGLLDNFDHAKEVTLYIESPLTKSVHKRICDFYYQLDPWRRGQAPHIIHWVGGPGVLRAFLHVLHCNKVQHSLEVKMTLDPHAT